MDCSSFGTQFYPTPLSLGVRMVSMIDWDGAGPVLDVSAGKGDLLAAAALRSCRGYWKLFKGNLAKSNSQAMQFDEFDFSMLAKLTADPYFQSDWEDAIKRMSPNLWAIELDEDLQSVLRNKGYRVIGSDFFTYSGASQPSYILMNPPFQQGASFLMRAIDFLYSGQIVCVLNAQTLLNPYSLERQALVKRLNQLNARIEYLDGQFVDAERPTGVRVAVVYIDKRVAMDDAFEGAQDKANDHVHVDGDACQNALVSSDRIVALVEHYEAQKTAGVELLLDFHKRCRNVPYLDLTMEGFSAPRFSGDAALARTELIKAKVNFYLANLRKKHWTEMMNDPVVTRWLTKSKKESYLAQLNAYCDMDFTESNIRQFVTNVSASYPETLSAAIEDVFDEFTVRFSYHEDTKNNVHMYSGWLSNKASYVNKRVVIPRMSPFDGFMKRWGRLSWGVRERLADFEKVMSYFDGGGRVMASQQGQDNGFVAMADLIDKAVLNGQTTKIETEYFFVTVYMKGTVHLTFKSEELRRRFNIFVGTRRAYLPPDYAKKSYREMDAEEKRVVDEFEGVKSYKVDEGVNPFSGFEAAMLSAQNGHLRLAA